MNGRPLREGRERSGCAQLVRSLLARAVLRQKDDNTGTYVFTGPRAKRMSAETGVCRLEACRPHS